MSAAKPLASPERYDRVCALCHDGVPEGRFRGKAACGKCLAAIGEAGLLADAGPSLASTIRGALERGPRDYPEPLYERALGTRKGTR